MMIHEITEKVGKYPTRKRCGRGEGSGLGGTSGRGHKGAKSRSGWAQKIGYEGGAVPLQRRIPKRGFSNATFRRDYAIVNLKILESRFKDGAEINISTLAKAGLVRDTSLPLKVLGEGELTKKLTVVAEKYSSTAKSKIEAAGGSATVIERSTWKRDRSATKPASGKPASDTSESSKPS